MPLYIGVISGTSMDAVDAALVDFQDDAELRLLAYRETPYPEALAASLHSARRQAESLPLKQLYALDVQVARTFADAIREILEHAGRTRHDVVAVGSHGQTLCHYPGGDAPYTVQVGDPNLIAARTGLTVAADFRRMDMALGGEGAPLAPGFHARVFSHRERQRVIVNIGGIANVTILPIGGQGVMGFDSGPGNGLMDDWAQAHLGRPHDSGGAWARSGKPDAALLQNLSADAYFERLPPKSTGREYFGYRWLQERLTRHPGAPASADVQATLLELTAHSIAEAIRRFAPGTEEVYCCGGGVKNAALMEALRTALHPCPVSTTAILGIPPDAVEAVMCAWLAKQRLAMQPGNVPAVTGARSPAILGGVYLPPL